MSKEFSYEFYTVGKKYCFSFSSTDEDDFYELLKNKVNIFLGDDKFITFMVKAFCCGKKITQFNISINKIKIGDRVVYQVHFFEIETEELEKNIVCDFVSSTLDDGEHVLFFKEIR